MENDGEVEGKGARRPSFANNDHPAGHRYASPCSWQEGVGTALSEGSNGHQEQAKDRVKAPQQPQTPPLHLHTHVSRAWPARMPRSPTPEDAVADPTGRATWLTQSGQSIHLITQNTGVTPRRWLSREGRVARPRRTTPLQRATLTGHGSQSLLLSLSQDVILSFPLCVVCEQVTKAHGRSS